MTTKNKPNGSYSTTHGPNGGTVPTSAPPATSARRISTRASHEQGRAGSVDASVFSVADSASHAVSADRKATADLAEPAAGKQSPGTGIASVPALTPHESHTDASLVPATRSANRSGAKASGPDSAPKSDRSARKGANPFAKVPPGREPLPEDGEAFVDAVHAQVDLVALEVALLRSPDEKVVQRELGCLRELRYGKRAPTDDSEGTTEIIFDAPRPKRDLP